MLWTKIITSGGARYSTALSEEALATTDIYFFFIISYKFSGNESMNVLLHKELTEVEHLPKYGSNQEDDLNGDI